MLETLGMKVCTQERDEILGGGETKRGCRMQHLTETDLKVNPNPEHGKSLFENL